MNELPILSGSIWEYTYCNKSDGDFSSIISISEMISMIFKSMIRRQLHPFHEAYDSCRLDWTIRLRPIRRPIRYEWSSIGPATTRCAVKHPTPSLDLDQVGHLYRELDPGERAVVVWD